MKKLLCMLLAVLMLLGVLAACSKDESVGEETTGEGVGAPVGTQPAGSDTTEPESEVVETITIVEDGVAQFYIVASAQYTETLAYIQKDLEKKGGVMLDAKAEADASSSKHAIYVGSDYDTICPDAEVKLLYGGYAVVYVDGDIHFCGMDDETTKRAATKFLSSIPVKECVTKNAEGKITLAIPSSLMMVWNPCYTVTKPELLSVHVSEYKVVYAQNGTYVDEAIVATLQDNVGQVTGYTPDAIKSDAAEAEHEIILNRARGTKPTLKETEYAIKSEGSKIYIDYGSTLAAVTALEELKNKDFYGKTSYDISKTIDDTMAMTTKGADEVRIISSNVLFTNAENAELPYEQRAALLSDIYLTWKPDFIGLQESKGGIGDAIKEALADEYGYINQALSGSGHTPILYDKDVWEPVTEGGQIVQKHEMFQSQHCWDYEWVMFQKIDDTDTKVIMMNLHFQPRGYKGEERPESMDKFNAEVQRLESVYPTIPIIATGDYNTRLTMGRDPEIGNDGWNEDVIIGTNLQSSGALTEDTDDPNGSAIDHVCVSKNLVTVVRNVRIKYELMVKSSDHQPVFADIKLTPPTA
ncbi:MAG: hypothetical protein E7668_02255 [Ruminococcaceae bacterium]|nr:hypothetical protein [Oscillospiraceae bacterium]